MVFCQQSCFIICLFIVLVSLVNSELVCEDKVKSCKKWTNDKKLCDENGKYKKQRFYVSMSRLCKKSCLMCGDDDASLFDTDSRCNSYFKKGYCDMKPHQGFMLRRCKYSCRNTIRSGIMSPGRGNFQRNNPPAQQQQGYWNQQQADNHQHYGQQYPQQYGQQYAQNYGQQHNQQQQAQYNGQQHDQQQAQYNGQQHDQQQAQYNGQQHDQQQAQYNGQQHDQQQAQYNGQQHDQQQAQYNGQQQYPQQYAQQNYAQPQQTAGQQQPQAQPQGTQSLGDLPVQVQAMSSRKHKLEKKKKHDDMNDDTAVNDTDDDMD